jgi:chromosome segregation ATPase
VDPNDREQTELLRLIWNEMKALGQNLGARIDKTNERLDQTNARLGTLDTRVDSMRIELKTEIAGTNARLDQTNERLDQTNERLDHVEGALRDLAGQQLMLGRYVKNAADRHDGAIDDLRERVTRLETTIERKG